MRARGDRDSLLFETVGDADASELDDPTDVAVERLPVRVLALPERAEELLSMDILRGEKMDGETLAKILAWLLSK